MKTSSLNKTIKSCFSVTVVTLFWLAVWEAISLIVDNGLFVPSPAEVFLRLFTLCAERIFWKTVLFSVLRITAGLFIGIIFGLLFAFLCAFLPLEAFTAPFMTVIKATPVASFIMLAWIWLRRNYIPVFISALIVIPIVFVNTLNGVKQVKGKYGDFARVYRLGFFKKLVYLYAPGVMPQFSSAILTCAGMVWKAGIAAEVLCQPELSVGGRLFAAKSILETTDVFAWTLVVIMISLLLENTIKYALKRVQNDFN